MAQIISTIDSHVFEARWDDETRRAVLIGYPKAFPSVQNIYVTFHAGELPALISQLQDVKVAADMADEERRHVGGNAEDCRACDSTNPPYPHICPGEGDAA